MAFLAIGQTRNDSVKSSFLGRTFESGRVTVGYDYGLLPFLANVNPPQGNLNTTGSVDAGIFKVPVELAFNYSSVGTISGLNNYFTIRYDAQRYREGIEKRVAQARTGYKTKLDSLEMEQQRLLRSRSYLRMLKAGRIAFPVDSSLYRIPHYQIDSLTMDTINTEYTYEIPQFTWNDSLENVLSNADHRLGQITDSIPTLKGLLTADTDSLLNMQESDSLQKQISIHPLHNLLSKFQKFEIGLCYPSYSEFLVRSMPVRGFNTEVRHKNLFVAFTAGKTVNNIFLTNNLVNNNLNAVRNLYNFFDFDNIKDGRRIVAGSIGYESKTGNYLRVGLLSGKGQTDYTDTTSLIVDSERNLVAELTGLLKVFSGAQLQLAYGRSAIQTHTLLDTEDITLADELVDMRSRTNAAKLTYQQQLKATNTDFELSARLVDPFFRSFGLGFVRSDNFRYQLKATQKIGPRLSLGGMYRKEQDNLLQLYEVSNIITSFGANLTYRVNRNWMLKADYRPITQELVADTDSLGFNMDNRIITGVLSYQKRIQKTYIGWTNIFSSYLLYTGDRNNTYTNVSSSLNFTTESGWMENLTVNYFHTSDTSVTPSVTILQNDLTVKHSKGWMVTATLKASISELAGFQGGYGARVQYPITKSLNGEVSAEKLVIGDFYNSILQSGFNDYPFLFRFAITAHW